MQIPETPQNVEDLDLIVRLKQYADGGASYLPDDTPLGTDAKTACLQLHAGIIAFTETVAPLLDRINAREMDTFTMHDRKHALKVAHLMWYILKEQRRCRLTPPEIALLVASAYLHDLGMFLSKEEREARLDPGSDLWERLEIDEQMREKINGLQEELQKEESEPRRKRLIQRIVQAEEALLCQDTRERHATRERYEALHAKLKELHDGDPENIPDPDSCLSFQGDSFRDKLIDICVSHNEDAEALVVRDPDHSGRDRFPKDYVAGSAEADLQLVAAALRLADILDFDRERTPSVLYYYLLPGPLDPAEDRSALEWAKHLAICKWTIEPQAVVFKGRCKSHIVHHAVVQFCDAITEEIAKTKISLESAKGGSWPFIIPPIAECVIQEDGYRYVPYKFELDDGRIHNLLMGGAIYENPLDCVRELVQNAVDACRVRDALTKSEHPEIQLSAENRIFIEYAEPTPENPYPVLTVRDTGCGMDELVINRWFLKIGRSYYNSSEFNRHRVNLRAKGLDFAPVSEFGIGFLSCFLLADKVEVESAMWEPVRGDTRRRVLSIHGPTRLIRLNEHSNTGTGRLIGTRVSMTLTRGNPDDKTTPPTWPQIEGYLRAVCLELPYRLDLKHVDADSRMDDTIVAQPALPEVPADLEGCEIEIPVNDTEKGIEGTIILFDSEEVRRRTTAIAKASRVQEVPEPPWTSLPDLWEEEWGSAWSSSLLRGGFKIGGVPGLPYCGTNAIATIRLVWEKSPRHRYQLTSLSRSRLADSRAILEVVEDTWCSWLIENLGSLQPGALSGLLVYDIWRHSRWLERHSALSLFALAAHGWHYWLNGESVEQSQITAWEEGRAASLPVRLDTYSHSLWVQLLNLLLPRVSALIDLDGQYRVSAPSPEWKESLQEYRDFITHPTYWGPFISLERYHEDTLSNRAGFLNLHHRARVEAALAKEEIARLRGLFSRLSVGRTADDIIRLNAQELALLRRAKESLGDLLIRDAERRYWRIDSFELPETSE